MRRARAAILSPAVRDIAALCSLSLALDGGGGARGAERAEGAQRGAVADAMDLSWRSMAAAQRHRPARLAGMAGRSSYYTRLSNATAGLREIVCRAARAGAASQGARPHRHWWRHSLRRCGAPRAVLERDRAGSTECVWCCCVIVGSGPFCWWSWCCVRCCGQAILAKCKCPLVCTHRELSAGETTAPAINWVLEKISAT